MKIELKDHRRDEEIDGEGISVWNDGKVLSVQNGDNSWDFIIEEIEKISITPMEFTDGKYINLLKGE